MLIHSHTPPFHPVTSALLSPRRGTPRLGYTAPHDSNSEKEECSAQKVPRLSYGEQVGKNTKLRPKPSVTDSALITSDMNILDKLSGPGFVERVHELHMDLCTM